MNEQNINRSPSDVIVGIDLGTTNSLIAVYRDSQVDVIDVNGGPLLPSYVGLTASNELLVGHPARNQYILSPDRTIKSIKRRMGGTERIDLGDRSLLPEEISALILSHLKSKAEETLGIPIAKAVITVPAYFNDIQRQATHAAGEIAGLEVVRIVNEPTAAALAFRHSVLSHSESGSEFSAVYDLGGGTFDVSILREEGDVLEVLASRGDTRLGGDDFDRLILDHFLSHLQMEWRVDLREDKRVVNRLIHAAEAAKIQLSAAPFVRVVEENLTEVDGKTIHLDLELSREQYEDMIRPLIDRTLECIQQALHDAQLSPAQIDNVLLAGGSTRTPLVRETLEDYFQNEPRSEIHPDLCVVMGAALLAARVQGQEIKQILVDITPFTFGIQALITDQFGYPFPYHFAPIINRNTPLPITQSQRFSTYVDNQEVVQIDVYQGESDDVRDNTKIGNFIVKGLSRAPAGNVVIARMSLDLNGILTVTAIEKTTGLQKSIKIEGVGGSRSKEDIEAARHRISDLIPVPGAGGETVYTTEEFEPAQADDSLPAEHREILERARDAYERMHPDDRQEAQDLVAQIEQKASQGQEYDEQLANLRELLYFVGA